MCDEDVYKLGFDLRNFTREYIEEKKDLSSRLRTRLDIDSEDSLVRINQIMEECGLQDIVSMRTFCRCVDGLVHENQRSQTMMIFDFDRIEELRQTQMIHIDVSSGKIAYVISNVPGYEYMASFMILRQQNSDIPHESQIDRIDGLIEDLTVLLLDISVSLIDDE